MNSTAKKRRTWVEKGHKKSPRKKRSKRKEPYGVPTTIKRPRRGAEKEPYRKHQNEKQPFEALKLNRTRKRNRTRQRNSLMDEGLNRLKFSQKISKEPNKQEQNHKDERARGQGCDTDKWRLRKTGRFSYGASPRTPPLEGTSLHR